VVDRDCLMGGQGVVAVAAATLWLSAAGDVVDGQSPVAAAGVSEGLCGGIATTTSPGPDVCGVASQAFGLLEWEPCCFLDIRAEPESAKCRTYELGSAYCSEARGQDCSALSSEDTLSLSLTVKKLDDDHQCCKSCVCFGDPECVSFHGVEDLWIPCDAREDPFHRVDKSRPTCRIYKDICDDLTDPNNNPCQWIRPGSNSSAGWDMAVKGSPCVPDLSAGEITMNMYTSKNGKFAIDLYLGERGIIQQVKVSLESQKYVLDADRCFDVKEETNKASAWETTSGSLPSTFSKLDNATGTEVGWQLTDPESDTSVFLLCVRATENVGLPRINVQSLNVLTTDADLGSGFCVDDKILEAGQTEDTYNRHMACVASDESALQACKFLVSAGLVDNQLDECGASYCTASVLGREECMNGKQGLRVATKNARWVATYCKAIVKQTEADVNPVGFEACQAQVLGEGWPAAVKRWGKGTKEASAPSTSCGSSLEDYVISKRQPCEDGVFLEVDTSAADEGANWVPKYFFPTRLPPCEGVVFETDAVKDKDLFRYPVSFRQCDSVVEEGCADLVATCSKTSGAEIEIAYTNTAKAFSERLTELYKEGKLRCSGPDPNGGSNPNWCVEPDSDSVEMCPCDTSRLR